MKGKVLKGQLTHVDTDQAKIQLTDVDGDVVTIDIDSTTEIDRSRVLSRLCGWADLLGMDIEVIVVDGKATIVNITEAKE